MKLLSTTDYSIFETAHTNRNIGNTKKLEASFRKHGFIPAYPLHVIKAEGKLVIKAGHHRFTIASKLGLPVWYIVSNDNITITEAEDATNKWSIADFAISHQRVGDKNYMDVIEYHERTGIAIGMCISMLGGEMASSGNKRTSFKEGTYKTCPNQYHANTIEMLVLTLKSAGIKWATDCKVIQSLSRIVSAGHADIDQLKKRIVSNSAFIVKKQNLEQYMDLWQEIYNRNSKGQRLQLVFLTNETIKERLLATRFS
jgi:hypothetical protein